MARFDADYEQGQVWQRLVEGKRVKDSDIILLRHELEELKIMKETKCSYEQAHDKANMKYNWESLLED